jgi:serine/threonine protein kinase
VYISDEHRLKREGSPTTHSAHTVANRLRDEALPNEIHELNHCSRSVWDDSLLTEQEADPAGSGSFDHQQHEQRKHNIMYRQNPSMAGTPYYMSIEILERRPHSYPVDLWALGIILYECFCGAVRSTTHSSA